ncbi:MAG: hypothetical protein AMXMBFR84_12290 [Candidatus Hydrogenedentota bacterium]
MRAYLAAAATLLFCVLNLTAARLDWPVHPGVFKMLASTSFLAAAWFAGARHSRYGLAIFAGLFFSWWGDYFLIGSGDGRFLAGLVSFFLAHVVYCIAYGLRGANWKRSIIPMGALLIPGGFVLRWLWPGIPADMRIPVIAYMIVISLMVALAIGTTGKSGSALIILGAILFYFSDIFVARARFVESGPINSLIGLPLYFGGQVLLALSIAYVKTPPDDQTPSSA